MAVKIKSDTTSREDAGQLLDYYRKEKKPPGARGRSVWDQDEQEPVTRLRKDDAGRAEATAAKLLANIYPASPAQRMGPETVWDDHEYAYRAQSDLNQGVEDGEKDLVRELWPLRKTKENAAKVAKRLAGR